MSYYRIIDGHKYDRQLLELADELVGRRGDGRISNDDARQIARALCDGDSITEIERATADYILREYNWTDSAEAWFRNNGPLLDETILNGEINAIRREYGLWRMAFRIDPRVVETMNCRFPGTVSFYEALRAAVVNLLTEDKRDSPFYEVRNLVEFVFEINPEDLKDPAKYNNLVTGLLKERMNAGYLQLVPIFEEIPDEETEIPGPDNDATTAENWIFFLGIVTDDHQFWSIVERSGEGAAYTYGFN